MFESWNRRAKARAGGVGAYDENGEFYEPGITDGDLRESMLSSAKMFLDRFVLDTSRMKVVSLDWKNWKVVEATVQSRPGAGRFDVAQAYINDRPVGWRVESISVKGPLPVLTLEYRGGAYGGGWKARPSGKHASPYDD